MPQCGMEFDRGFSFCRSFQLPDPCEHLWCAHQVTLLVQSENTVYRPGLPTAVQDQEGSPYGRDGMRKGEVVRFKVGWHMV